MLLDKVAFIDAVQDTFEVTVASGAVASDLTDFPLYIDLADMPDSFWTGVDEGGGNIRAYQSDGTTLIPHFVVGCFPVAKKGWMFAKRTLTSASDTVVVIKRMVSGTAALAVGDANGRNAVWSDYEACYWLGHDPRDMAGKSSNLAVNGDPNYLIETATSGAVNGHEGVVTDGAHYYVIDSQGGTAFIRKYNLTWVLIAETEDLTSSYSNGLGGGAYFDGKLYISADNAGTQYIAVYNAGNLSFIEQFDIDSFANAASGFAYNPNDGLLYTVPYTAASSGGSSSLIKIDPSDGSNQGTITMSSSLEQIQDVIYWQGAFWLPHDGVDETYRVELDGTIIQTGLFGPATTPTTWEGGDAAPDGDGIIILDDTGATEVVRTFKNAELPISSGGGLEAAAVSRSIGTLGSAIGTTWTVGISARQATSAQQYFLGVVPTGGFSGTQSVHIGVDGNAAGSGQDRLAVFDGSNSWLYSASNAVTSTVNVQRVNVAYNGTTARSLWVNGGDKGTDSTITARGTGIAVLNIGAAIENAFTDAWVGEIGGYVYLRESLLSDDWIAAEFDNLNAPGSFYTITTA